MSQQCTYNNEFGPADRNQNMQIERRVMPIFGILTEFAIPKGDWAGTTLYTWMFKRSIASAASETIPWATFERHRWLPFVPIASFSSRTRVSHFVLLLPRCTEDACRRLIEPLRDPGRQQNNSMVDKYQGINFLFFDPLSKTLVAWPVISFRIRLIVVSCNF